MFQQVEVDMFRMAALFVVERLKPWLMTYLAALLATAAPAPLVRSQSGKWVTASPPLSAADSQATQLLTCALLPWQCVACACIGWPANWLCCFTLPHLVLPWSYAVLINLHMSCHLWLVYMGRIKIHLRYDGATR